MTKFSALPGSPWCEEEHAEQQEGEEDSYGYDSDSEESPEEKQARMNTEILYKKSSDLVAMRFLINKIKQSIPNEIQMNDEGFLPASTHLAMDLEADETAIKKKIQDLPINLKFKVIHNTHIIWICNLFL